MPISCEGIIIFIGNVLFWVLVVQQQMAEIIIAEKQIMEINTNITTNETVSVVMQTEQILITKGNEIITEIENQENKKIIITPKEKIKKNKCTSEKKKECLLGNIEVSPLESLEIYPPEKLKIHSELSLAKNKVVSEEKNNERNRTVKTISSPGSLNDNKISNPSRKLRKLLMKSEKFKKGIKEEKYSTIDILGLTRGNDYENETYSIMDENVNKYKKNYTINHIRKINKNGSLDTLKEIDWGRTLEYSDEGKLVINEKIDTKRKKKRSKDVKKRKQSRTHLDFTYSAELDESTPILKRDISRKKRHPSSEDDTEAKPISGWRQYPDNYFPFHNKELVEDDGYYYYYNF